MMRPSATGVRRPARAQLTPSHQPDHSGAVSAAWDCISCGATAQQKSFCETCGAAMPVEGEGEDTALALMLGLVCERCDAYNDPGLIECVACGAPLPSVEGSGKFPALAEQAAHIVASSAEAAAAPVHPPATTPDPAAQPSSAAAPAPMAAPVAAPAPVTAPAPSGEPSGSAPPAGLPWMAAPTGQPLATRFALPKVDLATISTPAHGVPLQPPSMPAPGAAPVAPVCPRCGTAATGADRFCRTCGSRLDASAPLSTTQIAALKLPAAGLPSPVLGTAVMPAFGGGGAGVGAPGAAAPTTTRMFGAASAERVAKLVLVRGQSQFGSQWRLQAAETVLGRTDGAVLFPDDDTLAHRHCRLSWKDGELWVCPEPSTNGVYLRLRGPTQIGPGDEFVVGSQRLRVLGEADRPLHMSSPDPSTRVLGSLVRPGPSICLLRIAPAPAEHEVFHRHQRLLTMGRSRCDVNFARDGFVSERHAQLTRSDDGPLTLEDLRSRNGTYLRLRQAEKLVHGDLLLLGDKVLRVELPR